MSFAATNLVKPGLQSKRQQSEPPLNRNVFPPTPPPESEKSGAPTMLSRGASVRNGPKPVLPTLDIDKARPVGRYEIREQRRSPQSAQARIGTQRTASEPRGPQGRQMLMRSESRSRPSRRRPSEVEIDDEYPGELYEMYHQNPRGNKSKRGQAQYIEEEEEYASDSDDGPFDEGEFEMISRRPPPRTRTTPTSASTSSRGQSRRPEVRRIRVKVHAEDVRYIMIGSAIEFSDLVERIRDKFEIRKRFKIKVREDDEPNGDMITLGDQDDLEMVLMSVKANARKERLDMGKMEVSILRRSVDL